MSYSYILAHLQINVALHKLLARIALFHDEIAKIVLMNELTKIAPISRSKCTARGLLRPHRVVNHVAASRSAAASLSCHH